MTKETMERMQSLDEVLKQRRLSVPEILAVMKGICRGLAEAHQRGVLHLHLSPQAIRVSPDFSQVELTGFGGIRGTQAEALSLTSTLNTGALSLGAFHYLAPEQLEPRPGAPADHRADIYSAGAIFQELLTGRPPGGKFSLPSQSNSELLPETDVIVLKALDRDPSDRYATALDLLADLERLEEALRVRLLSEIRGITHKASSGPGRGLLIAMAALLLAALAVAAFLFVR